MNSTSLTNFNVPNPLKSRFDAICHASGRTRTSVLVELMESYILSQAKVLQSRAREFEQIDERISFSEFADYKPIKRHLLTEIPATTRIGVTARSNQEFDLPEFLVSDGQEEW